MLPSSGTSLIRAVKMKMAEHFAGKIKTLASFFFCFPLLPPKTPNPVLYIRGTLKKIVYDSAKMADKLTLLTG